MAGFISSAFINVKGKMIEPEDVSIGFPTEGRGPVHAMNPRRRAKGHSKGGNITAEISFTVPIAEQKKNGIDFRKLHLDAETFPLHVVYTEGDTDIYRNCMITSIDDALSHGGHRAHSVSCTSTEFTLGLVT